MVPNMLVVWLWVVVALWKGAFGKRCFRSRLNIFSSVLIFTKSIPILIAGLVSLLRVTLTNFERSDVGAKLPTAVLAEPWATTGGTLLKVPPGPRPAEELLFVSCVFSFDFT